MEPAGAGRFEKRPSFVEGRPAANGNEWHTRALAESAADAGQMNLRVRSEAL